MAQRTLEERVSTIEAQLAGKTLEEHFRAQAELIDERFAVRDAPLGRLQRDVSELKTDVAALKKDMVIVREGIGILLKR